MYEESKEDRKNERVKSIDKGVTEKLRKFCFV